MTFLQKVNSFFFWVQKHFTEPVFGSPIIFGIFLIFLFIALFITLIVLIVKLKKRKEDIENLHKLVNMADAKYDNALKDLSNADLTIKRLNKELTELKNKPTTQTKKKRGNSKNGQQIKQTN